MARHPLVDLGLAPGPVGHEVGVVVGHEPVGPAPDPVLGPRVRVRTKQPSYHRIDPVNRGWAGKLARGPNGRALCRECRTEVPRGRRTFCGDPCVDRWKWRTDPGFVRRKVFERDQGICSLCGRDTIAWATELIQRVHQEARRRDARTCYGSPMAGVVWRHTPDGRRFLEALARSEGLAPSDLFRRETLWDADHVVPVAHGGGLCGLDGYRTLCIPCHRGETRRAFAARPRVRRAP